MTEIRIRSNGTYITGNNRFDDFKRSVMVILEEGDFFYGFPSGNREPPVDIDQMPFPVNLHVNPMSEHTDYAIIEALRKKLNIELDDTPDRNGVYHGHKTIAYGAYQFLHEFDIPVLIWGRPVDRVTHNEDVSAATL